MRAFKDRGKDIEWPLIHWSSPDNGSSVTTLRIYPGNEQSARRFVAEQD